MAVKELTKENYEEVKKGNVVVDFYADWCGPCQMLKPVFAELSEEMDDVVFAKVNTETEQELAMEFGVRSIPMLVVMKDGKQVETLVGYMPKEQLKAKIEEAIK